jgi:tRNA pseudouridine32 synthase/23S rRNA pseudouridine746 synthase
LSDKNYHRLKKDMEQLSAKSLQEIADLKALAKSNKEQRDQLRTVQKDTLDQATYAIVEADLVAQSLRDHFLLKDLKKNWKQVVDDTQTRLAQFEDTIEALKNERRERSATLQQQLFEQYVFLNKDGKSKSLYDIFSPTAFGKPPSAAGECATPKLLQFAFKHGYTPLAMAEFWWGAAPKSEIRQHKQFYPACTGKCKPILAHMLDGMLIDENPFLSNPAETGSLDIVFEDESFIVINKPAGLRSVPGVNIPDSVQTRLKHVLIDAEPLIVHRLDMGTSGLLVVAKTKEAHKHIQKQFLQRTVSKRYTALLSKVIGQDEGIIDLPLAPDFFNRPRQLVCFTTGKKSITKWQVIKRFETTTKVHVWPLTGRAHQLRMHSAHELGLNAPIVGDDIYGTPAERMYLHAAYIELTHPKTKEKVCFEVKESF